MDNSYKYCVYLIYFEDGSVYIGSTNNLKRRIKDHEYCCKIKYKNKPVYLKMNECEWKVKILYDNIQDRETAIYLEESSTLEYRDNNYNVLNIKNGNKWGEYDKLKYKPYWYTKSESEIVEIKNKIREKISKLVKGKNNPMYGKVHSEDTREKMKNNHADFSGEKNPKAKPKEYFENNSTTRSHFKETCRRMNWDFEDFKEVFAEWYVKPSGKRERKYFYIEDVKEEF